MQTPPIADIQLTGILHVYILHELWLRTFVLYGLFRLHITLNMMIKVIKYSILRGTYYLKFEIVYPGLK